MAALAQTTISAKIVQDGCTRINKLSIKKNFHFRFLGEYFNTLFSSFFFGSETLYRNVYFDGIKKNCKFPIYIVHSNLKKGINVG